MQSETRPAASDADVFADLVEAVARRRDGDAFARLFAHYGPRVKAYFRRLGTADDTAEELMQDVMLTLWRRAEMFDRDRASVATWLFAIARNRRIDVLRREYRPQVDAEDPALVGSPAPPADQRLQADQAERRLRQALATLPAEQAELVRESFFRDRSHSVIAAELRLPLGTVKSRLRLALAKLRGALRDPE
jgi:RNA polymerase sigma-70 factor, ECF subfamily